MPTRIRRALLFMPGDDRHKIEKGASLQVDSVIIDLEDGVALNRKETARSVARSALREVNFGDIERIVRINPVIDEALMWKTDIEQTIEGQPDAYMIPKVEHAEQLVRLDEELTRAERNYGWIDGRIRTLAIIESARAVVNLKEIASSSTRLAALVFGAEDFVGDLGAIRTPDGWEVFYARSAVVTYAKAYGLQAIDTPYVDLTAEDSNLIADTEQAHYMGYTGKLAIHPRQVPLIQSVFTPTDEQIRQAKALITAHQRHQNEGVGVFVYDGRMVDMPMIRAADGVLARARAAGKNVE